MQGHSSAHFTGCRSERIEYKIALISYKALKTLNPPYLADLLEIQVISRAVRSDAPRLVLPRTRTELPSSGIHCQLLFVTVKLF